MHPTTRFLATCLVLSGAVSACGQATTRPAEISVTQYASIQEALRANPGRRLYVPAGDYRIAEKISIRGAGSGLFGPGRIVQTNSERPILEIEHASDVQIRDLTLTRPEGKTETRAEALVVVDCQDVVVENVQVIDNRTCSAAIALRDCRRCQVRNCRVENYMRISIDDRTKSEDYGYAFRCIDGTGISSQSSHGTLLQGNRIVEHNLLPTPEIKQKYELGKFVRRNPRKGLIISQQTWDRQYVDNWHQGSAIIVNSPTSSDCTQLLGNYIENAAQGIDIHSDHVIIAQNIVNNSFMGMKAMHGSRNVLILGNQFLKNDLWAIGLMPGAASHAADPQRKQPANTDGGSIIAHNIISDFGYGHAHWIWNGGNCYPIRLDGGQKPDNPPLADVLIDGNLVYDTGRDAGGPRGKPEPPRYRYAIFVSPGPQTPRNVHFSSNLLHPGTSGVANVELKP
jgi:hypothetical protein